MTLTSDTIYRGFVELSSSYLLKKKWPYPKKKIVYLRRQILHLDQRKF